MLMALQPFLGLSWTPRFASQAAARTVGADSKCLCPRTQQQTSLSSISTSCSVLKMRWMIYWYVAYTQGKESTVSKFP